MRIVGGRHKGRRLAAPGGRAVRPTTDRLREAVFDVLMHSAWGPDGADPVTDAAVLDAFCGTGALGLEALSRGAARAWFLDTSPDALDMARRNATALGEAGRAVTIRADATRPPPARTAAGLVFLDPPYGQGLAAAALVALAVAGWLAAGCVAVVELSRRDLFTAPPGFTLLDDRSYGETHIVIVRYAPT
jgi:16S rRNA (guanine966-N2)-methyltransferase